MRKKGISSVFLGKVHINTIVCVQKCVRNRERGSTRREKKPLGGLFIKYTGKVKKLILCG